jgi:hypothetical protein
LGLAVYVFEGDESGMTAAVHRLASEQGVELGELDIVIETLSDSPKALSSILVKTTQWRSGSSLMN